MSTNDPISMLRAANPLSDAAAEALPLAAAETALRRRILLEPVAQTPAAVSGRRRPRFAPWPLPRPIAALCTVAIVAASVLAGLAFGGGSTPSPAFAAALVRFANATPRVLLTLPGWHVAYVQQQADGYGEIHFSRGPDLADENRRGITEAQLLDRFVQVTWTPLTARERGALERNVRQHTPTGLGVPVLHFVTEGGSRHWVDLSAFFIYDNRELRFRMTAPTMAVYRSTLQALHQVSATSWLRAMPASVIKSAASAATVRQMLRGVPRPPGFNAAAIPGIALTQSRYELAANVTGAVACRWIADWSRARAAGDKSAAARAIAAMATAPRWPVNRWMEHQGDYPFVLIRYAQAMPRGRWFGHSLTASANLGLGCSRLGVNMGAAGRATGLAAPSTP